MTYKDQFVVEVMVDGKILRVRDGAVYLPFGCEYSILLKNLNSKKASVKVSIDGEDVLDGYSLVVQPLVTHELKGFLRGTTARNRFRFIQKSKEIQDHRGDKVDDGLLRVEFAYEKPKPEPEIKHILNEKKEEHHHHYYHDYKPVVYGTRDEWSGFATYSSSTSLKRGGETNVVTDSLGVDAPLNVPLQDEGITVKGNEINDQYKYASIGELEESSVIVIQLKGVHRSHGVSVQEPITVDKKLICSSCGMKSKSSFKFCPQCGTFLE